jgi:hypothetical protein
MEKDGEWLPVDDEFSRRGELRPVAMAISIAPNWSSVVGEGGRELGKTERNWRCAY